MPPKDRKEVDPNLALAATVPNTDIDLSGVTSIEDARALWENVYRADETLGDGFTMIKEKDQLIGVPFFVPSFKIVQGDFGKFAVVSCVTQDNRKLRFTDGGTGIVNQLLDFYAKTGQAGGLAAQGGLVRSDYEYEDQNGEMKPASTFYFTEG